MKIDLSKLKPIELSDKKFFDADDANDLTWSRWFFPLINCDGGLKIVDKYFQYYDRCT